MQCIVPCRLWHQLALHNVLSSPLQAAGLSAPLNSGPAGYETSFSAAEKPKPLFSTSWLESRPCWKPKAHEKARSKAKRKWSCHHCLPPPAPREYSLAYQYIVSVVPCALRWTQVVTSDIRNDFHLATISWRLKSAPLCEVERCRRGSTVEWRRHWIHAVLSSFHYSKRFLMKRKTAGKSLPCRFHGVAQNGLTWHSVFGSIYWLFT